MLVESEQRGDPNSFTGVSRFVGRLHPTLGAIRQLQTHSKSFFFAFVLEVVQMGICGNQRVLISCYPLQCLRDVYKISKQIYERKM